MKVECTCRLVLSCLWVVQIGWYAVWKALSSAMSFTLQLYRGTEQPCICWAGYEAQDARRGSLGDLDSALVD